MTYCIVRVSVSMADLEVAVNKLMGDGWKPSGTPFWTEWHREWCQAMTRANGVKPGEVRLKEPRR